MWETCCPIWVLALRQIALESHGMESAASVKMRSTHFSISLFARRVLEASGSSTSSENKVSMNLKRSAYYHWLPACFEFSVFVTEVHSVPPSKSSLSFLLFCKRSLNSFLFDFTACISSQASDIMSSVIFSFYIYIYIRTIGPTEAANTADKMLFTISV